MKRPHLTMQRRPLLRGPAGKREPWLKLAHTARTTAEHASGAVYEAVSNAARPSVIEQLRYLRLECPKESWPIEFHSSALIAECFLAAVDAFAGEDVAAGRRTEWASLVREAASAVIALLDEQNAAEGAMAARRYGGAD